MNETWIRRRCRQTTYNQLFLLALMGAAISLGYYTSLRYWQNFIHGPYGLTSDELAFISEPSSTNWKWISTKGLSVVSSGVQIVTTETRNGEKVNSYVSSRYFLMQTEGGRLLIIQSEREPSTYVRGVLKTIPEDLVDKIFPDKSDTDLKARLYPFLLDTAANYRCPGYIVLAATAMFSGFMAFFGIRAIRRVSDISRHPVVKRVEGRSDAAETALSSERELQSAVRFKGSAVIMTENFVVRNGLFSFDLFPINHLVWAYKRITTRRINFIPISKTFNAVLVFYGGSIEYPAPEAAVEEALVFISSRAPWAEFGYSEELSRAFRKDPAGRCAAIEDRRNAMYPRRRQPQETHSARTSHPEAPSHAGNIAILAALRQNLRLKVGYDEAKIDRLIEFERTRMPNASPQALMQAAIERWERDNR